jgi:predicted dienelactone hydrolase
MKAARRTFLLGTASAVVFAHCIPGARSLQAQELPYQAINLDWTDSTRGRSVPARLYLPNTATAEQPVPLIVFSHGLGGSRNGYTYLGTHWASQGFASLHLQHVGSDRSLWSSGSPFSLASRLQDAANDSEAIDRVHDLRFALDRVLASALGARLDSRRIVAAGHSYGANTSLMAAGATVVRNGSPITLREPRVSAAILISAPPFYGETSMRQILAPVQIPSLHITATEDIIRVPGYYSGAEDRLAVFEAVGSSRKMLAVFTGGSHSMFTDRTSPGGDLLNAQVKTATRELTSAFLNRVIGGTDDSSLRDWPQRYAAIVSRFSGTV